ncbi:MAG: aldo/keto reductase [Lactobacillaceae bacterium]|jgi:diketogulonate reductase-like aldo/keto reductase|nr:aldo/keto reductase [Lactobacillaceae bacterium]
MYVYTLANGDQVPAIGFGTWPLKGETGKTVISTALENGYTYLDSAFNYENEGTVAQALRESGIPREQIEIASKLPGRHHAYDEALTTIQESLYRMDLTYLDVYLIHWPNPLTDKYVDAWRALIEAKARGLVKHIGVSNFTPAQIERLIEETGITPEINQIELHPYFNQEETLLYDREHKIITQAWSPLGRGNAVLTDPVLLAIADAHHKSVGQVILRWDLQRGVMALPKSTSGERQLDNLNILDFVLTDDEVQMINSLSKVDGRTFNQDPDVYEEF